MRAMVGVDVRGDDPLLRGALLALGVLELGLGLWMAVAPVSFFDALGPFGGRNDHYLRDMASWELALGVVALVAARRPAWRVPVLALALVHFALHALNHLLDVSESAPGWVGPVDLAALTGGALLLGWLLARAARAPEPSGRSKARRSAS